MRLREKAKLRIFVVIAAIILIINSCNSISDAAVFTKSGYVGTFAKVRYEFVEIDKMTCISWKSVLANNRGLTCNWDEWDNAK